MLEVGRLGTFELDRAHFGAWVITSMPLILGLDLRHAPTVQRVWPIIANTEAIAINQQWAGHPGRLVKQWDPSKQRQSTSKGSKSSWSGWGEETGAMYAAMYDYVGCDGTNPNQTKWSYDATNRWVKWNDALCMDSGVEPGNMRLVACNGSKATQRWECAANGTTHAFEGDKGRGSCYLQLSGTANCATVNDWNAQSVFLHPCGEFNSQRFTFGGDGSLSSVHIDFWNQGNVQRCLLATPTPTYPDPAGTPEDWAKKAKPLQLWAKPQPGGAIAVFLVNMLTPWAHSAVSVTVHFAKELGLKSGATYSIRDVWRRSDVGVGKSLSVQLDGYDSVLFLLSPKK